MALGGGALRVVRQQAWRVDGAESEGHYGRP